MPTKSDSLAFERVQPGAFARSIAEASSGARVVRALWQHRHRRPLASTPSMVLREDDHGLVAEFETEALTDQQRFAIHAGEVGASIGFDASASSDHIGFYPEGGSGYLDGRGVRPRVLAAVDLIEISLLPKADAAHRATYAVDANDLVAVMRAERTFLDAKVAGWPDGC